MSTDPRLENYLARLEAVLSPFAPSDRAEIVLEIKSHVMAALDRDPKTQLDSVLAALGEPEAVANRYLIERGLQHSKPPVSPIVKWVVIGFLGTLALIVLSIALVVARFSPLLRINEKEDFVSLLNGTVEISGKDGNIRIGGKDGTIQIDGKNGKIHIGSKDGSIRIEGEATGDGETKENTEEK